MIITKKTLLKTIRIPVLNRPLTHIRKNSALFLATACLAIGFTVASSSAQATSWKYLAGGYNSATGQPNGMTDKSSAMPADLLTSVLNRLPEGQSIASNPTVLAQLTNDLGANVFLKAPANVKVSYVSEGAGYENSVGFFKFNTASLTTLAVSSVIDTIIFPNFSDTVLQFGKTVDLGQFAANDAIGFTIVGNGWQTVVNGKGTHTGAVDSNKAVSKIFRTIKRFNPEPATATNQQAHTILFSYPEKQLMVLAFEDLNRQSASNNDFGYTSDNDFNDVIIAIHVTPFSAVDCSNCTPLIPSPPIPTNCGIPVTKTPIPSQAMSNDGKKVNICHFPPGNPENYQNIQISVNALNTHLTHHDDVFRINGQCPPISAGICAAPPVCIEPEVLNASTNTCVTPPPVVCTTPKVRDAATNTCVTPPPVTCITPQVRNEATNTCITPVTCTAPQVPDATNSACIDPPPVVCTAPKVRDSATNTCINPPPISCTAPDVFDSVANGCVTPPPIVCTTPLVPDATNSACINPPDVVCTEPEVRNPATNTCVTPVKCKLPKIRDEATNTCVTAPPVVCNAPQVRDASTNTCVTLINGESGPISWREITMPEAVKDTRAEAKAAAQESARTKAAAGQ
ncbi:DUF4114 domain-containing protein [Crenothrix sp.]|uniref:DUF4114 domain-containing protein n=1 Tax=Crenothrix sp. TaxID=3100433 RepID=UPI00374D3BE0